MAVVRGIYVLSCYEAYARFPVEARACKLDGLCKRWRGNNMVQCLVLDRNSLRVAREISNLAAGNLGVLRQINDRAGTARFCCSVDLGKTAAVRLSTGEMVHCTYAASWPTNTKCASGRKVGESRKRGKDDESTEEPDSKVSRCLTRDLNTTPHSEAGDTACLATVK